MKEQMQRLWQQARGVWEKTNRTQKIFIGAAAGAAVVLIAVLVIWATTPDYGPLFTQLDEQSAGQITAKLKEMKIPYKLEDNGRTILVPRKNIDELRVTLASQGLPTGGVVGFETFDEPKFGESETERQARYLRALQGELTRTIESIPEVDKARVHIVLPEPSIFEEKQKEATAAVWLQLKPGKKLQPEQVEGLVRLVANSVEGLKPQNVTILDTNGNILTDKYVQDEESMQVRNLTELQQKYRQSFEEEMEQSIQSMLDRILGQGKSVVRVRAELDFDKVEINQVEHGKKKVVISEQKTSEISQGTGGAQGPVGTPGNVAGGITNQFPQGGGTTSSEKTSVIRNYEPDRREEKRQVSPGGIKKLSVAVVVDGEISNEMQQAIEDTVRNAAGIDPDRGDQISVVAIPFNTKYLDEVKAAMAREEQRQRLLTYGGIALGVLAAAGILIYILRSRKKEEGVVEEELLPVQELAAVEEFMPTEETPTQKLSSEEKEKLMRKEQVEKLARQNPADVAQLLKTWLMEE